MDFTISFSTSLTHCNEWRPQKGYVANSADPDQMPQNAASDQYPLFANILIILLYEYLNCIICHT